MEKTNIGSKPLRRLSYKNGDFVITGREALSALFILFAFFAGRVLVFDYLNPVVTAYLAVFLGGGVFYIASAAALAGLMTNIGDIALFEYLTALALLTMANYYITQNKTVITNAHRAVIGSVCVLAGGIICSALNDLSTYANIISAVEAVVTLSLTIIFIQAVKTVSNIRNNPVLSSEQLISISVMLGVVFVGMAGLEIKGIYLRDVLALWAVLSLSYTGGASAGCLAGIIFSIIMFAGAGYTASFTGILGVSGIVGGIFKDFGKFGSAVSFLIGILLATIYIEARLINTDYLITLCISIVLFMIMPRFISDRITLCFASDNPVSGEKYIEKVKGYTARRIKGFSDSFKILSSSYKNLAEKKDASSQKELSGLVDKIAQNVCKTCSHFELCWVENLYMTYQSLYDSLVSADKRGYVTRYDLSPALRKRCSNPQSLVEVTNRLYLVYITDIKWHNKIIETKELMASQLKGVSGIMKSLTAEISEGLNFAGKYEKIVREELEKLKIDYDYVLAIENSRNRLEIEISVPAGNEAKLEKSFTENLSSVIGRNLTCDTVAREGRYSKIKISESELISIAYGAAKAAKDYSVTSGDNFTCLNLEGGRCVIALSDGMGTGSAANGQSVMAIELLEQLLESGFDEELSVELINSALLLKTDDDFFTTLDVMIIDRYSGVGKIIKIGAVETYLARDEKIQIMRQSSLPAGIMPKLDIEVISINLKNDDTLLLMTDGITDSCRNNSWIHEALFEYKGMNPQNTAEYIVNRAKAASGNKVKDDMTAIVVKIHRAAI
jgi:stage II sporulation protein E